MGALSDAIAASAVSFGAEIVTKSPVAKIMVKDSGVSGIELVNGIKVSAKYVISNADPKQTFLKLVRAGSFRARFRSRCRENQRRGLRPESECCPRRASRLQSSSGEKSQPAAPGNYEHRPLCGILRAGV